MTIPQDGSRGGVVLAIEGDRWIVTLIGLTGERPPADLDGFIEYARTLWVDDLHDLVATARPLGEASTGGFPSYLRHRYDRLRSFPSRYVVTGDALCSLNPVYAQGMSVAIGEARDLGHTLDQHGLDRVGPRFFQRTKRTLDEAWTMATGADLGYPRVQGRRPARWRLINAYVNRLLRVAHRDPMVATAFMEVNGMVARPQHLMRPRIVSRVFLGGRRPAARKASPTTITPRRDGPLSTAAKAGQRSPPAPPPDPKPSVLDRHRQLDAVDRRRSHLDGPATRRARMLETTITSADGTTLAARHSGHGSPMVLVHGAIGSLETFALIEGLLAERHSVWVYSRRGRGGSGDGPHYGLDREVEDVLAVLAAAGDHAHLLGHSGGAIYSLLGRHAAAVVAIARPV